MRHLGSQLASLGAYLQLTALRQTLLKPWSLRASAGVESTPGQCPKSPPLAWPVGSDLETSRYIARKIREISQKAFDERESKMNSDTVCNQFHETAGPRETPSLAAHPYRLIKLAKFLGDLHAQRPDEISTDPEPTVMSNE